VGGQLLRGDGGVGRGLHRAHQRGLHGLAGHRLDRVDLPPVVPDGLVGGDHEHGEAGVPVSCSW
jgi:hypothetical protein